MDWTLKPFNPLFWAVTAFFIGLLAASSLLLRQRSVRTKTIVLVSACLVTLAGFAAYKYALSLDADYDRLIADMDGFNWWGELPLHMCNINMILIPVAVLTKRRPLMGFCFFVGSLSAMMALTMPGAGFDGWSLFLPRMLGYYGTHFMLMIEGFALVSFGFFRPVFRDLPSNLAAVAGIAFVIFLVDLTFRLTGLYPRANYFFAMETEGNVLLELFRSWIPFPYLYLLPGVLILAVYMALVMAAFALADGVKGRRRSRNV